MCILNSEEIFFIKKSMKQSKNICMPVVYNLKKLMNQLNKMFLHFNYNMSGNKPGYCAFINIDVLKIGKYRSVYSYS